MYCLYQSVRLTRDYANNYQIWTVITKNKPLEQGPQFYGHYDGSDKASPSINHNFFVKSSKVNKSIHDELNPVSTLTSEEAMKCISDRVARGSGLDAFSPCRLPFVVVVFPSLFFLERQ